MQRLSPSAFAESADTLPEEEMQTPGIRIVLVFYLRFTIRYSPTILTIRHTPSPAQILERELPLGSISHISLNT